MSLEDKIDKCTAAIEALTASLAGKSAAAKVKDTAKKTDDDDDDVPPAKGKKTAAADKKKGPTLAAVQALGEKLRKLTDAKAVNKITKKVGKADSIAEMDKANYASWITAVEEAIEEAEDDDEDDDEDEDDDDE